MNRLISALAMFAVLGSTYAQTPSAPQISADDKAKIEVLHDILLGIQREPTRWKYMVVDRDGSNWSAKTLENFLNSRAGRFGYELVSTAALPGHRTRFIFKAKE